MATEICAKYDFTNLADLSVFVGAAWYGDENSLTKITSMTTEDVTAFYAPDNTDSFGYALNDICSSLSGQFGCANPSNCTASELATLQWGQSFITENPIGSSPNYLPVTNTVTNWGDYKFGDFVNPENDVTTAPEYAFYKSYVDETAYPDGGTALNNMTSVAVVAESFESFGLRNPVNAAKFAIAAVQDDVNRQLA